MIKIINKSECTGCTACASVCPVKCIRMVKDEEGFLYPQTDEKTCINCGICEKRCPVLSLGNRRKNTGTDVFAAINHDTGIRVKSSSGGIFPELAKNILQTGGVVIGAGFEKDFSVSHKSIEKEEDIPILQGSKYVQSTIGQEYIRAKEYLESGRKVLFTGTPCQVAGLYTFLGKEYENLLTQDVVCHGVPSPEVWKKYLEYQNKKTNKNDIEEINFRDKTTGWKNYSFTIFYKEDKKYSIPATQNFMMRAFLENLCLRPSCYNCKFKNAIKESDITLADFWGVEKLLQEMDDNKGTSTVFLNSSKGKTAFFEAGENIEFRPVDHNEVIKYNLSAVQSSTKPAGRDEFMLCVENKGFEEAINKYFKESLFRKIKNKLKIILKLR